MTALGDLAQGDRFEYDGRVWVRQEEAHRHGSFCVMTVENGRVHSEIWPGVMPVTKL